MADGGIDSKKNNIWQVAVWQCSCIVKNATDGKDAQLMGKM